jgi:hypothetical protein
MKLRIPRRIRERLRRPQHARELVAGAHQSAQQVQDTAVMQELQKLQRGDDGIGVLVQRIFQRVPRGRHRCGRRRQWNRLCHGNLCLLLHLDLHQFAGETVAGLPPFSLDFHAALRSGMAEAVIDARQRTLAGRASTSIRTAVSLYAGVCVAGSVWLPVSRLTGLVVEFIGM